MRRAVLVVAAVAIGVAVARALSGTERGQELTRALDARAHEFGAAVAEAYRQRQADLRAAIEDNPPHA